MDVYGDWIDAAGQFALIGLLLISIPAKTVADAVAKEQRVGAVKLNSSRGGYASQRSARDEYEDDVEAGYQGDAIVGDDDDLE